MHIFECSFVVYLPYYHDNFHNSYMHISIHQGIWTTLKACIFNVEINFINVTIDLNEISCLG